MDDENKKQDLSNISIEEEEMTNPYLRGHRLTTVVNKAYDCPDAYNPAKLSGKCIKTLLLPRILDVFCFYVAAAFFFWNLKNKNYRYFAKRILNPQSTTSIKSALISSRTILATLVFIIITAGVFMLRISFIKSKRKKTKNDNHIPKEAFPKAYIEKGRLVFSTVFFAALLFGAYFVISLILKKKWSDMPVKVDLAICAGVLILLNIRSCIKVGHSVIRCYTCHVIANMMGQEFKVTDVFYADSSLFVPTQKYDVVEKTFRGTRLEKINVTGHVIGDVHTYKDIKHNRNRISCVCPYCLQVYEQRNVVVNDTYEGKSYTVTDTIHDQQHKSPTKYI